MKCLNIKKKLRMGIFFILVMSFFSCSHVLENRLTSNNDCQNKSKHRLRIELIDSTSIKIIKYKKGTMIKECKTIYVDSYIIIEKYENGKRNGWSKYYNCGGVLCRAILYKDGEIMQQKIFCSPSW